MDSFRLDLVELGWLPFSRFVEVIKGSEILVYQQVCRIAATHQILVLRSGSALGTTSSNVSVGNLDNAEMPILMVFAILRRFTYSSVLVSTFETVSRTSAMP